jgi:ribosome-binding ATPase YchF (GTP1/OBG family)
LDKGEPIRSLNFTIDEIPLLNTLPLITAKPLIFACNIDADSYSKHGNELTKKFVDHVNNKYPNTPVVILSSLLENELVQIHSEEGEEAAKEYM